MSKYAILDSSINSFFKRSATFSICENVLNIGVAKNVFSGLFAFEYMVFHIVFFLLGGFIKKLYHHYRTEDQYSGKYCEYEYVKYLLCHF